MAYKIATPRMEVRRPVCVEDLRRAFETAVCQIHQAERAAGKKPEYYAPIVPRRRLYETSPAGAEKRALSDAAQALALLWKV